MKQIEEVGKKNMDIPLFDSNKFFNKNNNAWLGFKNTFKVPGLNDFRNDIKLFSPPNNFDKSIIYNNQNNALNNLNNNINNKNEINIKNNKFDIINPNSENKNNENKNEDLNKNPIDLPNFPSFFNDNNEILNKKKNNKNSLAYINKNIISKINPINNINGNNLNKVDKLSDLICFKEPPMFNTFLENYPKTFNNFLCPINSSIKNNLIINPINNKFYNFPFNSLDINNEINLNRNNYFNNNISLLGNKKRF